MRELNAAVPDVLPEPFRSEFDSILKEIQKKKIRLKAKYPEDDNVVRKMRNQTASKIAERLFGLYEDLLSYCNDKKRGESVAETESGIPRIVRRFANTRLKNQA